MATATPNKETTTRTWRVGGMDCANCAASLEKGVCQVPGVVSASVNFSSARLEVELSPEALAAASDTPARIERRVRELGFSTDDKKPSPGHAHADHDHDDAGGHDHGLSASEQAARRDRLRVAASGALLALGLAVQFGFRTLPASAYVADTLFVLSLLLGGSKFALAGLRALRTRTIGTNLLVVVAAVGAMCLNQFAEGAAVVFLYALGETLEAIALDRTRRSLATLLDAAPSEAVIQTPGTLAPQTVPAAEVAVGDTLIVRPGARLAADGVITSGTSSLTEAAITGESLPVTKTIGETVYAGSINGEGGLLVSVTAPPSDTTLARILHLVEKAQEQKAPTEALVAKFGRIYTPFVLVSAVLLAVLGPVLFPGARDWVYSALTLLVVACPCALIIATPVAYVCGIARAARMGVLFKGGAYLEALAGVKKIALDKTGTITTGRPAVTEIVCAPHVTETHVLTTAAAVESFSDHPLAHSVLTEAEERGIRATPALNGAAVLGRGVTGTINGQMALVGTPELLQAHNIAVPAALSEQADRLAETGGTLLWVALNKEVLGFCAVSDTPRPEAKNALADLVRLGITPVMLTGDNPHSARFIGAQVGITDIHARLLPEDKWRQVQEIVKETPLVFVGDGINDAPALAAATVGVAMGSGGTAAALEAADVALMKSDLARLAQAVRLARTTRAVVQQNVVISLGTVVALLLATFAGHLALPVGVVGHEASALLVILNGLRLLSPRLTRF